MDAKIVKSARMAAVIMAAVTLAAGLFPRLIWQLTYDSTYSDTVNSLYLLWDVLSYLSLPAMGLLSVGLFKRCGGSLSARGYLSLVTASSLTYVLIQSVAAYAGITVFRAFAGFPVFPYLPILLLVPSFIGSALGGWVGMILFSSKNEKISSGGKRWVYCGLIFFVCLLGLLFYGYIQQINPKYVPNSWFAKMAPLTSSVAYQNARFTCSFENTLDTEIKLINVSLNESIAEGICTVASTDVQPNLGDSVKAGGTFTINADDCPVKSDGESYDLIGAIHYQTMLDGVVSNHTDMGHIKGQGEPGYEPGIMDLFVGFFEYTLRALFGVILFPLDILFVMLRGPVGLIMILVGVPLVLWVVYKVMKQ